MSDAAQETTRCAMCDQAGACTDLCRGTGEGRDASAPTAWTCPICMRVTAATMWCGCVQPKHEPTPEPVICPVCGEEIEDDDGTAVGDVVVHYLCVGSDVDD